MLVGGVGGHVDSGGHVGKVCHETDVVVAVAVDVVVGVIVDRLGEQLRDIAEDGILVDRGTLVASLGVRLRVDDHVLEVGVVHPVDEDEVHACLLQPVLGVLQGGHGLLGVVFVIAVYPEGTGGVEPASERDLVEGGGAVDIGEEFQLLVALVGIDLVGIVVTEVHDDGPSAPLRVQGHVVLDLVVLGVPDVRVSDIGVPSAERVSGPVGDIDPSDDARVGGDQDGGLGSVHVVEGDGVHVEGVQGDGPLREGRTVTERVVASHVGVPSDEVALGGGTVGLGDGASVGEPVGDGGGLRGGLRLHHVEGHQHIGDGLDEDGDRDGLLQDPAVPDLEDDVVRLGVLVTGERLDGDVEGCVVSSLEGTDGLTGGGVVGEVHELSAVVGPSQGVVLVLRCLEEEPDDVVVGVGSRIHRLDGDGVARHSGGDEEGGVAASVDGTDGEGLGHLFLLPGAGVHVDLGLDGVDDDVCGTVLEGDGPDLVDVDDRISQIQCLVEVALDHYVERRVAVLPAHDGSQHGLDLRVVVDQVYSVHSAELDASHRLPVSEPHGELAVGHGIARHHRVFAGGGLGYEGTSGVPVGGPALEGGHVHGGG